MPAPLAVSELYKADANKLLSKGGKRRRSISHLQQLGADDPLAASDFQNSICLFWNSKTNLNPREPQHHTKKLAAIS